MDSLLVLAVSFVFELIAFVFFVFVTTPESIPSFSFGGNDEPFECETNDLAGEEVICPRLWGSETYTIRRNGLAHPGMGDFITIMKDGKEEIIGNLNSKNFNRSDPRDPYSPWILYEDLRDPFKEFNLENVLLASRSRHLSKLLEDELETELSVERGLKVAGNFFNSTKQTKKGE